MPRPYWAECITEVLRLAQEGGWEAVVTEGVPYDARLSTHSPTSPDEAHAALLDVLWCFGFRADIALEDRTQRRVRRTTLRGDPLRERRGDRTTTREE